MIKIRTRLAWLLGVLVLVCTLITQLPPGESLSSPFTHAEIIAELSKADIVYLGETHDRSADHKAQLAIITALYQHDPQVAIALEMFQRPYQPVLDQYLAGSINEAELREKTEYDTRWGFDWEYYAPILRFAKAHQLPLLALNTPTEVTRKVARQGLEALSSEDKRYIPPLSEIRLDNEDYRQLMQEAYQMHAHGGHGNSENFERFFAAQVLWDETMAQAIAQFWRANSQYQVVVLAGRGHIIYGYGIPSRVARRITDLTQRLVLLSSSHDSELTGHPPPADYFWEH